MDYTAAYESSLGAENSLPSTQLTLVSHSTLTKAGRAHIFLQMRAEVTTAKQLVMVHSGKTGAQSGLVEVMPLRI